MEAATDEQIWTMIMEDVLESLLSKLHVPDLMTASAVCRHWRRIVCSSALLRKQSDQTQSHNPCLFLIHNNNVHDSLALDLASGFQRCLRIQYSPPTPRATVAATSDGLLYEVCGGRIQYCHAEPAPRWHLTPAMRWWRQDPLVCRAGAGRQFLFVGGGCLGTEDDSVEGCVEILRLGDSPGDGTWEWEVCPPLPRCLSEDRAQALLCASDGPDRVIVVGRISADVLCAVFHVGSRRWSQVSALALPGSDGQPAHGLSLVGATTRGAVLVGVAGSRVLIWQLEPADVDGGTEVREVWEMPAALAAAVVGRHEEDDPWTCLSCVGGGDLLYFYSVRTHVVGLCRLSTLTWSTCSLQRHVGSEPFWGRSTTVVCAPVTIGQFVRCS